MGRTRINYNLVAQSSNNISKAASDARASSGVDGELSSLIPSIINEGREHDNCLAPYEGELNNIVTDISKALEQMDSVASLCMVAFNAFLEAEGHIVDGVTTITIDGTEFPNVKIESTGMKDFVNSHLDLDDLVNSANQETIKGKLSEEEWQRYELMFNKAMSEAKSKKEKTAVAAIFMTSVYPHMPYDWGGGHWAEYSDEYSIVKEIGEMYNGYHSDYSEDHRLHTFDCSGFTSWTLKEAGYPPEVYANDPYYRENGQERVGGRVVDQLVNSSTNHQVIGTENYDINKCSVGDIAYMHNEEVINGMEWGDHVGVIVAKEGDTITVAHVSGGGKIGGTQAESAGIGYTKMDTKTGLVIDDSTSKRDSRIGKPYFTHTASIESDTE